MILSLCKRVYISIEKDETLHTGMVLSPSGRSIYDFVQKKWSHRKIVQSKIILCCLLLLEVYTHLFVGLHTHAVEDEEPPYPVLESCVHSPRPSQLSHEESSQGPSPKL